MSPKKAQASLTTTTDYDSELFLAGKWLNLDAVPENSMDLVGVLIDACFKFSRFDDCRPRGRINRIRRWSCGRKGEEEDMMNSGGVRKKFIWGSLAEGES